MSKFLDRNLKVLLINSDKDLSNQYTEMLQEFVGKILPAYNGQEALFKFNNEAFNLLITDLKVTKVEGFSLALSARKTNPAIPILFIADKFDGHQKEILALGNVEMLQKPFDAEALEGALHKLLGAPQKKVMVEEFTVKAGEILFSEGDTGDDMYFIKSGRLDVFKKTSNSTHEAMYITTLRAGEIVGELSPITGALRSATVKAKEDTLVLTIPKKKLNDILEELPKWFKILLPTIISRLSETTLALATVKNELEKLKK